jgi:hypothetical protein
MQIIEAESGEMIYDFLLRVLANAYRHSEVFKARHNTTEIVVYPESHIKDLCDKFDMQRKINNLR